MNPPNPEHPGTCVILQHPAHGWVTGLDESTIVFNTGISYADSDILDRFDSYIGNRGYKSPPGFHKSALFIPRSRYLKDRFGNNNHAHPRPLSPRLAFTEYKPGRLQCVLLWIHRDTVPDPGEPAGPVVIAAWQGVEIVHTIGERVVDLSKPPPEDLPGLTYVLPPDDPMRTDKDLHHLASGSAVPMDTPRPNPEPAPEPEKKDEPPKKRGRPPKQKEEKENSLLSALTGNRGA